MCGINGTIRFRGTVDRTLLERQRDTMVHRGPDSSGLWCSNDSRVGFGHRRLAIIDLSPGGHQPMIDTALLRSETEQAENFFHGEGWEQRQEIAYRDPPVSRRKTRIARETSLIMADSEPSLSTPRKSASSGEEMMSPRQTRVDGFPSTSTGQS